MSRAPATAGRLSRLFVLLLLVAGLALIAGCGGEEEGGGEDTTTATESTSTSEDGGAATKDEYEARVRDALVAVTETRATLDEITDAKTADDLAAGVAELRGTYSDVADDLRALTPPEEVADLHTRLVDASDEIAQAATDTEESIRGGDADSGGSMFKKAGNKYGATLTELGEEFSARGYEFR